MTRRIEVVSEVTGEIYDFSNLEHRDPERMSINILKTVDMLEVCGEVTYWIYPDGFDGRNYSPDQCTLKQAMEYVWSSK